MDLKLILNRPHKCLVATLDKLRKIKKYGIIQLFIGENIHFYHDISLIWFQHLNFFNTYLHTNRFVKTD